MWMRQLPLPPSLPLSPSPENFCPSALPHHSLCSHPPKCPLSNCITNVGCFCCMAKIQTLNWSLTSLCVISRKAGLSQKWPLSAIKLLQIIQRILPVLMKVLLMDCVIRQIWHIIYTILFFLKNATNNTANSVILAKHDVLPCPTSVLEKTTFCCFRLRINIQTLPQLLTEHLEL